MPPARTAHPHLWFVRRAGCTSGPFPLGALAQEDALGRLALIEEVSPDGDHWFEPGVLRSVLRSLPEDRARAEWAGQRAMARSRWADQRLGIDRRAAEGASTNGPGQERRDGHDRRAWPETTRPPAAVRVEPALAHEFRQVIWIVLLLLAGIAIAAATLGPSNPVAVDLDLRSLSR